MGTLRTDSASLPPRRTHVPTFSSVRKQPRVVFSLYCLILVIVCTHRVQAEDMSGSRGASVEALLGELLERLDRIEARLGTAPVVAAPVRPPLLLDDNAQARFLAWSRDVKRNSAKWRGDQKRYLSWWAGKLAGRDLRAVSLVADLLPALDAAPGGRAPRIAVLKCFYAWLRTERHEITAAEDPTLHALPVPQAKPAQWEGSKDIPKADYLAARAQLTGAYRDALDLLAGTGWHVTELVRFAKRGAVEVPSAKREGLAVLVCPSTKSGDVLRTHVSVQVYEAAVRLRARRALSEENFRRAVRRACRAAGVTDFTPGRFRHAVATHAINEGASPEATAAFLGHRSPRTSRRFYATHATPRKVPTLA